MGKRNATKFCPKCYQLWGWCESTGGKEQCIPPEALRPTPDTFATRMVVGTPVRSGPSFYSRPDINERYPGGMY